MRRPSSVVLLSFAACWLAAGPAGATTRALLACRHHAAHAGGHHSTPPPPDGPCFCGAMTGGVDLAVSTAVPAPPAASAVVTVLERTILYQSRFPLPASPAFSPIRPPPNRLG